MKIISYKKQKELINLVGANQIIFNAFGSLDGIAKFEAFSKFCDNSSKLLYILGGDEALNEAKQYLFVGNNK